MFPIIFVVMKRIFSYIINLFRRRYHVVLDGTDNSVTLSKGLYHHISGNLRQGKVFVFSSVAGYGFTLNIPDVPTQVSDIQYNGKYGTIGFESLCPTVNKILYDYGLPLGKYRLSVSYNKEHDYYLIHRPYGKSIR